MADAIQYYPTSFPKKKAIALVVHGLNVKPIAMLSIIEWLNQNGSDAYLIRLSGHHENSMQIEAITLAVWEKEMMGGYELGKKASIEGSVPLYFVGYSLGALLGQYLITFSKNNIGFDKQILFAPATAIRYRSHIIKLLFFLGKRTKIPSFAPKEYRANDALPMSVYKILFDVERKISRDKFSKLNLPTLIFIDPKDELISYRKLNEIIRRFNLTNYQISVLDDGLKDRDSPYHHLILNEKTMGKDNWKMVTEKMSEYLFHSKQSL